MKLFLFRADIREANYMAENDKLYEDLRIVQAVDYSDAVAKYRKFWDDKCAPYDMTYTVLDFKLTETIV